MRHPSSRSSNGSSTVPRGTSEALKCTRSRSACSQPGNHASSPFATLTKCTIFPISSISRSSTAKSGITETVARSMSFQCVNVYIVSFLLAKSDLPAGGVVEIVGLVQQLAARVDEDVLRRIAGILRAVPDVREDGTGPLRIELSRRGRREGEDRL